jgi:hypothetical protein
MNTEKQNSVARRRVLVRNVVIGLATVFAVGLPVRGSAQETEGRRLEDAMPPEYAARVREIARQARDAGVPPGLIARKALEGTAKGYPPERVVTALDAYAGRLREARDILGPDRRPASLAAAAEALRRGVPRDAIQSMAGRERRGQDLAVPLIVLSDLNDAGVPTADALEMVNSAMDRGTRGDQMLGLSAAVRRRMQQGADWRTAVDEVRRRSGASSRQRDRQSQPDGARQRQNPSRRPAGAAPVPPGSEPPHRQRDGG